MSRVRTVPVKLAETVTTLYKADGALNPLLDEAVWHGARTEGLEVENRIAMVTSTPSAAFYEEEEQLGKSHVLGFDRIWGINPAGTDAAADFALERGKYVLVVYWESKRYRYWKKWTFYGVTAQQNVLKSQGQAVFGQRQVFGARYFFDEDGRLDASGGGGPSPTTPVSSAGTGTSMEEQCLVFTHLGVMPANDYFLGQYQFSDRSVSVTWAKAIAMASQTTATVVGLEVNGVMSSLTRTLPIGAAGTEVSNGGVVSPALVIPVGAVMRWKVISGPATVEEMGYSASINMNVS